MKFIKTKLAGCYILEPRIFNDERGYFLESFNQQRFNTGIGKAINFVQDNQSFSRKGVIRGLHYQIGTYEQAKLVRVLNGTVLDVAVDIRKNSPTFGEHIAVELSYTNKKQLFIPKGFAHGFAVLSATAECFYKCDNYYNKEAERAILYNDSTLQIDWKLLAKDIKVSEKDAIAPIFKNAQL